METYHTGITHEDIKHAADVSTMGLARSRATVVDPENDTPVATIVSTDASGDIARQTLDTANKIAGKNLIVLTEVSLSIFPELAQRKLEYNRMNAVYILDGGVEGFRRYEGVDNKVPNEQFTRVILIKEIQLLP